MPAEQKGAYSPQPPVFGERSGRLKAQDRAVPSVGVQRQTLSEKLETAFGGSERARRVVARQARDLADSGRLTEDMDVTLTVEEVISNMEDAPADCTLVERWNWWIGSLELSFGSYQQFRVRTDIET